jgi:hemolysin III
MIYLVIAGSYTPVILVGLENQWKIHMLAFIWFFALGGVFSKIFWFNAPRWISTIMYLLMGWVSLIILPEIWQLMAHGFVIWIAIGGISYSVGAIIYAIQKPDPLPLVFGFHEIWHLFVLGGAFSHFWGIYWYLPGL